MNIVANILAWVSKNIALIVGIIEAILKAAAGIVSITPTKSDDRVLAIVDNIFSWVKKGLYTLSDTLAGKSPNA